MLKLLLSLLQIETLLKSHVQTTNPKAQQGMQLVKEKGKKEDISRGYKNSIFEFRKFKI